jgi:hypothetical protein
MSEKQTDFKTILQDLKVSFRFAAKNIVSFFLGMLGVLIVSVLLLAVVAILIFVPILIVVFSSGGGFAAFEAFFLQVGNEWTTGFGITAIGLSSLIVIPILSPFFVAIGALFGMGRETVESEGTTAQGVFTWYKSKFGPLAAAGGLLFLTVLIPPSAIILVLGLGYGGLIIGLPAAGVSVFSTVWLVMSIGILSMMFPAVIDGVPVLQAYRQSVQMSIDYFDRVFGVWIAYLLLGIALVLPAVALSPAGPWPNLVVLGVYGTIMGLFLIFIVVPSFVIALNRVYLILSDNYGVPRDEEHPSIGMVGGV